MVLALSPEIVESRRLGIGASEIGQVIGLSPYGGPHAVWLEKTGRAKPFEGNEDTLYGTFMEPGIRDYYRHLTGHRVVECANLVHPVHSIARATPDGLVNDDRTLQIKCQRQRTTRHGTWGDPGTHDFPRWLWPQITWEMGVAGRAWADVAVLIDGMRTPLIYPDCPFDSELFEAMLEAALRFWHNHVLADVPPPLDGTPAATDWVKARYPEHTRPQYVMDDSPEMAALASRYVAAKEAAAAAELEANSLRNQIAERIGASAGIEGSWGGMSYTTAMRSKVDYAALCRDRGISDTDIARYTTQSPYRTMRVRGVK